MMEHYILNEAGEPVPEPDLRKWAEWFENNNTERRLALTQVSEGVSVSTVFLGMDHNWGAGAPLLWETMIFGGEHDQYQDRYSTKADALAGTGWLWV